MTDRSLEIQLRQTKAISERIVSSNETNQGEIIAKLDSFELRMNRLEQAATQWVYVFSLHSHHINIWAGTQARFSKPARRSV
jgi:hypothetical protein